MFSLWLSSLLFFSTLILLIASQVFWFRRARRLVRGRRKAWQQWLLGVPLYGWFLLMAMVFLVAPLRWALFGSAPVLLSLFMLFRQPVVMIPIGLWMMASLLSFILMGIVRAPVWLGGRAKQLWRRARASGALPASPDGVAVERRYFLQTATYAAGALPFVLVGYGFLAGRQRYTVEEVTVPIANLPAGLDGLRLVQLTDVHASAYLPVSEVRRVVGLASELKADLVFHTGDFITARGDPLAEAIAELARVPARYAAFGCLGNHEIYAGTTETATELFARQGVRLLRGQNVELEIQGAMVNLIGVDYQRQPRGLAPALWAKRFLPGVEKLVRPGALNILLTHNPNPFLRAAELGIELTLAGHTHGGQVQVEILDSRWSPARFITPFVSGLYDSSSFLTGHQSPATGHRFLYVSRGIGTIAAPVRLNAPPEITLLTLRRDEGAKLRGAGGDAIMSFDLRESNHG